MISGTLFKREAKSNYKLFLIFLAVLTMYSCMITSMFDPKLGESLKQMANSMPQIFSAFGMNSVTDTLIKFLANYLYGFLFIVFPAVFIILLSNKLIAKYVDSGSMAYLLSTPNKRIKVALTQAFFLIVSIVLLVLYVTVLCLVLSNSMFPNALETDKFIILNVGLLGLLIFFAGLCFCASCSFNTSKMSYGIGAGFIIAFILIQMVSNVGEKFEKLKYITPMTLFSPEKIIGGDNNAIPMFIILYVSGLILFLTGITVFTKRDLSI